MKRFLSAAAVPERQHRITGSALALISLACLGWLPAGVAVCAVDPLTEVQDAFKAGRTGEAMRRLDALIAARPHDARLRFQKGVMLVDQKRPNEAIALFQKLVVDYPSLPEPMNNLAVLYVERGDMEKARTTLEAAIRSKPNYGTAFQNLGDLYTRMASRAYARALQIDDVNGTPKLALIRNLYELPEASPSELLVAQVTTATPRLPPGVTAASSSPAMAAAPAALKAPVASGPAPARVSAAAPPGSNATTVATPSAERPAAAGSGAASAGAAWPGRLAPSQASASASASAPPPSPSAAGASNPISAPARSPAATLAAGPAASAPAANRPIRPSPPAPATVMANAAAAAEEAEVIAALRAWASAWSRRDVNAYFAAYAPGFKGADASADAWQAARRVRIVGKASIKVEVSAIKVEVDKNVARAAFRQSYSGGALEVNSRKTLELTKSGGRWLIRKESVGG